MNFMPHGFCMRWEPGLLGLHVVSDALIALAYFSIPLALVMFIRQRRDMNFGFIFWLFAAFILTCGITHVAAIVTLWRPDYWVEGAVKLGCAAVSVATAVLLWPIIPKALRIPSPSQMQEANDKLVQANADLVRKVEENRELAIEARQSERAKEEFLAVMSHEMRTPLNALLGMSSLLLDTRAATAEQQDYLETIRSSSDALTALVGNILDYTKLNAQEVQLHHEACQVAEVAANALDLLAEGIETTGLEFGIRIAKDFPRTVRIDAARLQQIVLNLVRNATKFTAEGEITLSLSSGESPDGRLEVVIVVADTGIGMTADEQGRLFTPFFQAQRSLRREYEGAGLGLAIVKRLCEVMEGTIAVRSELGRGSEFTVRLPVDRVADEASRIDRAILVVSTRPLFAECACSQLEHFGAHVTLASSVEEALAAIPDQDQVLIDHAFGDGAFVLRAHSGERKCCLLGPVNRRLLRLDATKFDEAMSYPLHFQAFADGFAGPQVPAALLAEKNPLRILVAEDNHTNQKVLLLLLRKFGYLADVASNGVEALKAWESSVFDLILMDIHMPELDGIAACQSIRKREVEGTRGPCRIAALTADAHSMTLDRCRAAGMDFCLTKPLKSPELFELLKGTSPVGENSRV